MKVKFQIYYRGINKVEAIKIIRSATGLGLKEAKNMVEKHWSCASLNGEVSYGIAAYHAGCFIFNAEQFGYLMAEITSRPQSEVMINGLSEIIYDNALPVEDFSDMKPHRH